jgi:hypothetical protein
VDLIYRQVLNVNAESETLGACPKSSFFCLKITIFIVELRFTSKAISREIFTKSYENNQQDALYKLIYYSKSAVRVSGDVFADQQEHLTVFTISGSVHSSCCRLVSRMS